MRVKYIKMANTKGVLSIDILKAVVVKQCKNFKFIS